MNASHRVAILAGGLLMTGCSSEDEAPGGSTVPDDDAPYAPGLLLDAHEVVVEGGKSGAFEIDVPEDALSVVLSAIGTEDEFYYVCSWVDPTGEVLVVEDWEGLIICDSCPNRVNKSLGLATALVPNNPDIVLRPGKHQVKLCADGPESMTVTAYAHAKLGTSVPASAKATLRLFFGGAPWSAQAAQKDEAFQAQMALMGDVLAAAGLSIEIESYTDVSGDLAVLSSEKTEELFEQAPKDATGGINVFFIQDYQILGDVPVLASSPCVQAPLVTHTRHSGIIVGTADLQADGRDMGTILAHELGHALGLYHTVDQPIVGVDGDQLADTPPDDDTYLMHWFSQGTTISPSQAAILVSNPIVE